MGWAIDRSLRLSQSTVEVTGPRVNFRSCDVFVLVGISWSRFTDTNHAEMRLASGLFEQPGIRVFQQSVHIFFFAPCECRFRELTRHHNA
jgi:hypothetical protein